MEKHMCDFNNAYCWTISSFKSWPMSWKITFSPSQAPTGCNYQVQLHGCTCGRRLCDNLLWPAWKK